MNRKKNASEEEKSLTKENRNLPREKVFLARNSLLTDLMKIESFKSIYNFFLATLILLFLKTLVYGYFNDGKLDFGIEIIIKGFGKFHIATIIWIGVFLYSLLPYILIKIWIEQRRILIVPMRKNLDVLIITLFAISQIFLLIESIHLTFLWELPIASSLFIMNESTRFFMKSYAFFRSLAPVQADEIKVPQFSWYMYFLFCPTLVYRDEYPRLKSTNWKLAIKGVLEVIGCTFYVGFLVTHAVIEPWKKFGTEDIEMKKIILIIFETILPAFVSNLCGFYLLLHAWHNATAEIFKFADKQFYLDWWNQSDYNGYYRTWNIIIHDWLHMYIYRDIIILTGKRTLATLSVFMVSAVVHEVILTVSFGFFYPVLFVLFGFFGVILVFMMKYFSLSAGNIFLLMSLMLGDGIIYSLYGMEYFARQNCPRTLQNAFLDYITPRSWICFSN